jgi:hypothetical protein
MERGWRGDGEGMERSWRGMERRWRGDGEGMEKGWRGEGEMGRGGRGNGEGMERGWEKKTFLVHKYFIFSINVRSK